MIIGHLAMQQLHILQCTFRFYICTKYCDQLHTEICPGHSKPNSHTSSNFEFKSFNFIYNKCSKLGTQKK